VSFTAMFTQAVDSIYAHFKAAGSKRLCVALAEEVSALNCLSSYCFTRFLRSLIGSVLQPLGTIKGIKQGRWLFINLCMLDLQGASNLSLAQ
jgi:hypothetical protein